MSAGNVYGRIVTDRMVETAVVATLNVWMSDCLGEIERVEGYAPGAIERPRDIMRSSTFDKMPEVQIPCLIVMNVGPQAHPLRKSDGRYDVKYTVGIAALVSDVDTDSSRDLAMAYTAAIRLAVGQHKMLRSPLYPDGFANSSLWAGGDTYADLPFDAQRSMCSGHVIFTIGVDDVWTEQAGPRIPSPSPAVDPGPWPAASEVEANTTLVGSIA
jgi:hypothetical protein